MTWIVGIYSDSTFFLNVCVLVAAVVTQNRPAFTYSLSEGRRANIVPTEVGDTPVSDVGPSHQVLGMIDMEFTSLSSLQPFSRSCVF